MFLSPTPCCAMRWTFPSAAARPTPAEVESLREEIDLAIAGKRLIEWYKRRIPLDPSYQRLRIMYAALADKARTQSWPVVGAGPTLEDGANGPRVASLRARLQLTAESAVYDEELRQAVERYQSLHGLDVDGKVGRNTLAHLDTGLDVRLAQIRKNLERHRSQWQDRLPSGDVRLLVNLPSYRLTLEEQGKAVASMKVIIGHPDTPTPLLDEPVERLVFSPYWYVPEKIAREEIVPAMLRNPGYGPQNNYEVVDRQTQRPVAIENWRFGLNRSLVVRQQPGDNNALGRVKFILPNDRAVYLHDTRAPELFALNRRALSHGCIRVGETRTACRYAAESES